MKRILITGTAGFIGFHLAKKLLADGYEVTGMDNINDYYEVDLKYSRLAETGIDREKISYNSYVQSRKYDNYRFIKLELNDREGMDRLFREGSFDIIVHLAAQAGVRYSLENPYAYIDSNIGGFLNILEGCRSHPPEHLLYASSSSVYGNNKKQPFSETDPVDNPVSLYAASKKSNELMAHTYSHLFRIPVTGLRFFTVYGPWGRPDMAAFLFTRQILAGKPIKVFNYGKMRRDFTYIDDIVGGVQALLPEIPRGEPACRLMNIGNSHPEDLMYFIETLEKELGLEAEKQLMPMQPGDVPETYADTAEIHKVCNYKPDTPIEYGVREFVKWYKSYYQ